MLNKGAYVWVSFVFLAVSLLYPSIVFASYPAQDSPNMPEVSDPECSFYLDRDNDGEGNERFDTSSETYVPQQTQVVGGCEFRLNAPVRATLLFESELVDWNGEVRLKQEPNPAIEQSVYAGDNEIPDIFGSMVVTANFRGATPRSIRPRTLPDNYKHEVQIPRNLRLISIVAITADGREDRLERNVQAASASYIQVHNLLSDGDDLPEWARTLGQKWLEEGYPQVADSIITRATSGGEVGGGLNGWMVTSIVLAVLLLIAVVTAGVVINKVRSD